MSQQRKAIIAFPVELHRHLSRVARRKHVTLAALVRATCESRHGLFLRRLPLLTPEALSSSGSVPARYLE